MQSLHEIIKEAFKPVNVGKRLLEEGHKVSYALDDLPEGEFVVEYPRQ